MSDNGEVLAHALDKFVDLINTVEGQPCAVVMIYVAENGGCPSVLSNSPNALDIMQFCVTHAEQSDDGIVEVGKAN